MANFFGIRWIPNCGVNKRYLSEEDAHSVAQATAGIRRRAHAKAKANEERMLNAALSMENSLFALQRAHNDAVNEFKSALDSIPEGERARIVHICNEEHGMPGKQQDLSDRGSQVIHQYFMKQKPLSHNIEETKKDLRRKQWEYNCCQHEVQIWEYEKTVAEQEERMLSGKNIRGM